MTTKETVQYVAGLAKLELEEHSIDEMTKQFDQIIAYIGEIDQLNIENIEPMKHVTTDVNVLRDDVVEPSLSTHELLSNAPKHNDSFFKVPKVIG